MDLNIEKLKRGDTEVFSAVFYFYSKKLYNYLYTKTKSEYFANEVVQLTFIKLWQFREKLNKDVKLSTQIFQIAKTTMIDEFRKDVRDKKKLHNLSSRENIFTNMVSGYELINEHDTKNTLQMAIESLPPLRKRVFQLSRQNQMSHKEISDELCISVKTVEKHIQLALKQIRPIILP